MGDRPSKKARTSDVDVDAQRVQNMQSDFQGDNVIPEGISDVSAGKQMIFIELCAGSAVLSAAVQKHTGPGHPAGHYAWSPGTRPRSKIKETACLSKLKPTKKAVRPMNPN